MILAPLTRPIVGKVALRTPGKGIGSLAGVVRGLLPDVWYDPSDLSTLYQDSAGTTPVTAVEQPVGLMLDKSRGLVLGSELFSEGDGTNVSGWTGPTGNGSFVSSGGQFVLTAANPISTFTDRVAYKQFSGLTSGKTYVVTATLRNISATSLGCVLDISATGVGGALATVSTTSTSSTPVRLQFTSTSSSAFVRLAVSAGAGSQVACDNISVRELPGAHAFHTPGDTTTRPVLSRRINLLTKTEQFDDAAWTKTNTTITANAAVAPDGTTTADKVVEDTATSRHTVVTATSVLIPSIANTVSVYAAPAERSRLRVLFSGSGNSDWCWIDLSTGVVTVGSAAANGLTASATFEANGFYKLTITLTPAVAGAINFDVLDGVPAGRITSYTGDGTSGIYIWGASLVPANLAALGYQRVNTATDYDSDATKFPTFLRCDGVNDSLQTNAIDFTSTDKMFVGAGVRKLSDAALGMIYEFGTSGNNAGSFDFFNDVGVYTWGTNGTANAQVTYTATAAPSTQVMSVQMDNAGAATPLLAIKPKINGASVSASAKTTGASGNYSSNKLYLFMRAGTSLPFNGWFYGGLIKGATLSASQIALVEKYLASKTKTVTV